MAASENPRARLYHIRDEIQGVSAITQGLSFEQYQSRYIHRRAVERAAQIVSEAARALPRNMLVRYADAPWSSIIGLGNILRREYQHLDDMQLWEIATIHLPALEPIVRRMIAEFDA